MKNTFRDDCKLHSTNISKANAKWINRKTPTPKTNAPKKTSKRERSRKEEIEKKKKNAEILWEMIYLYWQWVVVEAAVAGHSITPMPLG